MGPAAMTAAVGRRARRRTAALPWLVAGGTVLILGLILTLRLALRVFKVHGMSMAPALLPGEVLLVDTVIYPKYRRPRRGDIIVFRDPRAPERMGIKRVAAIPGHAVRLDGTEMVVSCGDEDLEPDPCRRIPDDHVFLLGDNQRVSVDSRHFGPVPARLVYGRAAARCWPPRLWCLFSAGSQTEDRSQMLLTPREMRRSAVHRRRSGIVTPA